MRQWPNRMPRFGTVRPFLLLVVIGVLLSGCLKLDATLTVNTDNTISGDYVVAYVKDKNKQDTGFATVRQLLVSSGTATANRYDDGQYEGTKYHLENVPLADLARFVPVTYEKRQTGAITITRDGDDYVVAGTFDFRETKPVKRTPEQQQQAEQLFQVRVKLTFPGTVESGSGTIQNNTITWQIQPFVLTTLDARASAVPPAPPPRPESGISKPLLFSGGLAGVAVLIMLGMVLVMMRRRRAAQAVAQPAVATAAVAAGADPSDFSWVVGDRRPARPTEPEPSGWAGTEVRYGPGLGGPNTGPATGPTPAVGPPWYGQQPDPAGGFGPPSGPVPAVGSQYGPPSGPVPAMDGGFGPVPPAAGPYGPPSGPVPAVGNHPYGPADAGFGSVPPAGNPYGPPSGAVPRVEPPTYGPPTGPVPRPDLPMQASYGPHPGPVPGPANWPDAPTTTPPPASSPIPGLDSPPGARYSSHRGGPAGPPPWPEQAAPAANGEGPPAPFRPAPGTRPPDELAEPGEPSWPPTPAAAVEQPPRSRPPSGADR
jgi:hypothetical protein